MRVPCSEFLAQSEKRLLLDVRAPVEFDRGHLPGAWNLPLFDDQERAEVGTIYREQGRDPAFLRGLELVGPKLSGFVKRVTEMNPEGRDLAVYCARGGERSASMAWLLERAGMRVWLLKGGYKAYRRQVLDSFEESQSMILLSGYTGSGKTLMLSALRRRGEQVIDLEALAYHQGSVFGGREQPANYTNEMFWNRLHSEWMKLERGRPVWLEDEARNLGRVEIPPAVFAQMRSQPVVFLEIPQPERVKRLLEDYGEADPEFLAAGLERIARRLGGERYQASLEALKEGDLAEVARLTLSYYDRAYLHGLHHRDQSTITHLACTGIDVESNVRELVRIASPLIV